MSAVIVDGSDQAYYTVDNAAYSPCLRVYDMTTSNSSIRNREESFRKKELSSALRRNSENIKNENSPKRKMCGIIFISVAVSIFIAISIALIVGVATLHAEVALLQSIDALFTARLKIPASNLTSFDMLNRNCLESISDSKSIQQGLFDQIIAKVTGNSTSTRTLTAALVDILKETGYPFTSCAAIHKLSPSSQSGYYHVRSSNGSAVRVYCDMTRTCGGITGGWMRVAKLDLNNTTTQCPSGLELLTSPRRTCRIRRSASALCSSDTFPVAAVGYSKVCGRIRAYQIGTPDAFGNPDSSNRSSRGTIESNYVDGVSLTHGTSPRQYIWTFAGANSDDEQDPGYICSCTNTALSSAVPPTPSFVGDDYFCDTGATTGSSTNVFHADDPLWDGAGCGSQSTCCSFNNPPWFYKQLPQSTTNDIEMRVCRDESTANEDFAIEVVEIYVQ